MGWQFLARYPCNGGFGGGADAGTVSFTAQPLLSAGRSVCKVALPAPPSTLSHSPRSLTLSLTHIPSLGVFSLFLSNLDFQSFWDIW